MRQIYYDFLTPTEKERLATDCRSGPKAAIAGDHPDVDYNTRRRIGEKRFIDKFDRSPFECPHGFYFSDEILDKRTIRQRLIDDDFLCVGESPSGPT